ncbi:HNH endonuclease [Candidatus Saccharibacteria bacterium]|nr:HNH endonuclease [Candidatus Saccharibacteria bacterium]
MSSRQPFYGTQAWTECANAYRKKVGGLCERCLKEGIYRAGEIVHHKIHLSPDNLKDPSIALSFDNLELLCRECHAKEHQEQKPYKVDELGRVDLPPIR